MINISEKENCCGCESCVQRCPVHCISMEEDIEGFLYPVVDSNKCINCGLCEKCCPMNTSNSPVISSTIYAAFNKNEGIRMKSSSGGVFTALAQNVLSEGGIVCGALFDNDWNVVHDTVEQINDLYKIRGSKYVQSRIGESYKVTELWLKEGRRVLFSGCPCQVAGLRSYLSKEYENLVLVDFVCHGVPSPRVWRMYLDELKRNAREGENTVSSPLARCDPERDPSGEKTRITSISFRDKRLGWKKFSFSLSLAKATADGKQNSVSLSYTHLDNPYMKGFLRNLYLRPSCHSCKFKNISSGSDIMLADFWGVEEEFPKFDDDKGVGLLFVNNKKVQIPMDKLVCWQVNYQQVFKYNPAIEKSSKEHPKRTLFFESYQNEKSIISIIEKCSRWGIQIKIRFFIVRILLFIGVWNKVKRILGK